jgi:L-aminopeptidase/D-esterase-like protein
VITDVGGILVGRFRRENGAVTVVVLVPDGTTGAVDQRGGAPGSRETSLLEPENLVQRVDAVCLSSGGAYGLAAADGVVRWLAERGRGFPVGAQPFEVVPIVPAAVVRLPGKPEASDGYNACEAAGPGEGVSETVGDFVIGALALTDSPERVIGVVAVDAALSKAECRRLAVSAHDGVVRAIRGRRGSTTIFVVATGARALPVADGRRGDAARAMALDALCSASASVFKGAVERAVNKVS